MFSKLEWMVCPKTDLIPFVAPTCDIAALHHGVFVPSVLHLPRILTMLRFPAAVTIAPVYLHALVIAVFASLLAPFGGFLASGVKRAFRIKDFGEVIPGHGGVTDRMDCQFLAGTFTFVWIYTFVLRRSPAEVVIDRLVKLDATAVAAVADAILHHAALGPLRAALGLV